MQNKLKETAVKLLNAIGIAPGGEMTERVVNALSEHLTEGLDDVKVLDKALKAEKAAHKKTDATMRSMGRHNVLFTQEVAALEKELKRANELSEIKSKALDTTARALEIAIDDLSKEPLTPYGRAELVKKYTDLAREVLGK